MRVYPKRGIMVSAISIGDIHQIFEVRALVEPYALTAHHDKLDLAAIARFSEAFHAYGGGGSGDDIYGIDDSFHETLISAIENDAAAAATTSTASTIPSTRPSSPR